MATFESMIKELENIVEKLEKGEIPLDKSIELYEKGTNLAMKCNEVLDNAEQKIKILQEDEKV
ncbi:MAG: exodeoxyribonuclease VII small subunit [Clostridia bacterium]